MPFMYMFLNPVFYKIDHSVMTRQKHAIFCKRVPVFVHIDVSSLWLSWSYPPLIFLSLSICIISFLFLAVYLLLVDFL